MIRFHMQSGAAGVASYFADGHDALSGGAERVGGWGGKGAHRLGLSGEVDPKVFAELCYGRHRGKLLTAAAHTRTGYDVTFNPPKSVTLALEVTQDPLILAAFDAAVKDTLRDIERDAVTRDQRGGTTKELPAELVTATFVHRSARPVNGSPDPQLHAHAFCFNAGYAAKRWTALELGGVKADGPYYEALFTARLAKGLSEAGYGIRRRGKFFELEGVSDSLVDRFSRRTALIEKEAEKRGVTNPAFKAELGGKTREFKGSMGYEALRKTWLKRLTADELSQLHDLPGQKNPLPSPVQSAAYALSHAFEREAVVPVRKVVEFALRHGVGSVTEDAVLKELDRAGLITSGKDCTTREMLSLEAGLVGFARGGQGAYRPVRSGGINAGAEYATLTAGQSSALTHVLASKDRVILVRGAAGTGKTVMLETAAAELRKAGLPVRAVAVSSGAAKGLEGVDPDASTLAGFLVSKAAQESARGGVVILDEAGQLGTRDAAKLVAVLRDIDARLLAVGDTRQHGAVAAGAPFKLWQRQLPTCEMTDVIRQTGEYRLMAGELSEHDTGAAISRLERLGWVKQLGDAERAETIATEYLAAVQGKQSVVVVSPTNRDAEAVSAAIRAKLKAEGVIRGDDVQLTRLVPLHLTEAERGELPDGAVCQFHRAVGKFKPGDRVAAVPAGVPANAYAAYRPAPLKLAAGDSVRITANGRTKDGKHKLLNGSTYAVTGFTEAGDIKLGNGWVVGKLFGHLNHAYVSTSHAAQGKTCDVALVSEPSATFPAAGREQLYVSLTRAKFRTTLFTDNVGALREAVDRSQAKANATDLVPLTPVRRPNRVKARSLFMARVQQLRDKVRQSVGQLTYGRDREAQHERG